MVGAFSRPLGWEASGIPGVDGDVVMHEIVSSPAVPPEAGENPSPYAGRFVMARYWLALVLPFLLLQPVSAQDSSDEGPRPTLTLFLGYANIDKAEGAAELGASAEIGSYRYSRLRVAVGVDRVSSHTERTDENGSFSDLAVNGDLRFIPGGVGKVEPYLGAGLGLHLLSNDYDDPDVSDIYDGLVVGVHAFLGAKVDMAETGRWGVIGEARFLAANDIGRTSLRAGVFFRF